MVYFDPASSTIRMTRSDGIQLNLTINQPDGTPYEIADDDVVTFLLFKEPSLRANSEALLTRTFTRDSTTTSLASMQFSADDTRFLNDNIYYYVIRLKHTDTGTTETHTYYDTVIYGRFILEY